MKHRPDSISGRIAAYCDTPRTMAEIQAAFAPGHDAKRVGWLVQDLVHNKSLVNLNRGKGRRLGGLYQDAGAAPEPAGPVTEPAATTTAPRLNLIDSIVAWCSQPRCMAAIEAEFAGRSNNPSSIVYNAVKAGLIVNLVDTAKHGRGWGGVYVQAHLRQAFWPQEPPGRTRRKRASKVAAAPPAPIPAKRRASFHSHIPPSPLAGGPQWQNLALVAAWAGLLQQGVHYNGPDMT
ncbi:MAG: hypothetical protein RL375_3498 [Pseudomonadota bacterium]|jgi:hypothetical protein